MKNPHTGKAMPSVTAPRPAGATRAQLLAAQTQTAREIRTQIADRAAHQAAAPARDAATMRSTLNTRLKP